MTLTETKCNDQGQDLWFTGGPRGCLTQFAAIWHNDDEIRTVDMDNNIIGSADALLFESPKDESYIIELKNVRVHPSFRRQGVATHLVEAVQNYAQPLNLPVLVYLHTDIDNFGARKLYESKGFNMDPIDIEKMVWTVKSS